MTRKRYKSFVCVYVSVKGNTILTGVISHVIVYRTQTSVLITRYRIPHSYIIQYEDPKTLQVSSWFNGLLRRESIPQGCQFTTNVLINSTRSHLDLNNYQWNRETRTQYLKISTKGSPIVGVDDIPNFVPVLKVLQRKPGLFI